MVYRYKPYADALGAAINGEFSDDVAVTFVKDPGATGNFEVTITNSGALIHSKATGGKGRCTDAAETQVSDPLLPDSSCPRRHLTGTRLDAGNVAALLAGGS